MHQNSAPAYLPLAPHTTPERQRPRRLTIPKSTLAPRYDADLRLEPGVRSLYLTQNEFSGGPDIFLTDDEGNRGPLNEAEHHASQIPSSAPSETRESEGASSVHQVVDLGFGAVANAFYGYSDCESLKQDAIAILEEQRQVQGASRLGRSSDVSCIEKDLNQRLTAKMESSATPTKAQYLPLDSFESMFDIKSMMLLLQEKYDKITDAELSNKFTDIVNPDKKRNRRRILGILVGMNALDYLEDFIQGQIWDEDLPIEQGEQKLGIMENWGHNEIVLFYYYQKTFFVPFFDIHQQQLCSYKLNRDAILPWSSMEHWSAGGIGLVYRLEIHPSHHNFPRSKSANPVFALKEIDAWGQKAYEDELAALEKTCAKVQKEKHLIRLLMTFRHSDKFYLLFEWADGNLDEFWQRYPGVTPTRSTERWAAEQCLGLVKAVCRIHGTTTFLEDWRANNPDLSRDEEQEWGRHGDIKPNNILWFEHHEGDQWHFVLSDLGLTRFHSQVSISKVPRSHIDGCTWGYRPPEMDMGTTTISRKYDIFSLGCVFLEFCVWYLQGYEQVQVFADERIEADIATFDNVQEDKFFYMDGPLNPRLKLVVENRISALRELDNCTTFAEKLLDIIENSMLCCNPKNRLPISEIKAGIREILKLLAKPGDTEEMSQALAGLEVCSLFTQSPTDMSEPDFSGLGGDSPYQSFGDDCDTYEVKSTRSEMSRHEDLRKDNHEAEIDPSVDISPITLIAAEVDRKPQATVQEVAVKSSPDTFVEYIPAREHSTNGDGIAPTLQRGFSFTQIKRHARTRSKQFMRRTWTGVMGIVK